VQQTSIRDGDPSPSPTLVRPLVLVAEDDPRLASFLDRALAAAGYRVERSSDGVQALESFERLTPDVIVLDLVLPGLGGLELARQLRERTDAPILILSGVDSVEERIACLDAGADDYLPVPFAIEELLARLRAVRRGRALAEASAVARARHGTLRYADLCVDLDTREVTRSGRRIELRNKAFELLACFVRHPERVLSRRELLEEVWGYEFLGDSNVIEVTVSHIRQALEAARAPRLIFTVRPIGYILRTDRSCPAPSANGHLPNP
jgi:two-component system response regulator MprA